MLQQRLQPQQPLRTANDGQPAAITDQIANVQAMQPMQAPQLRPKPSEPCNNRTKLQTLPRGWPCTSCTTPARLTGRRKLARYAVPDDRCREQLANNESVLLQAPCRQLPRQGASTPQQSRHVAGVSKAQKAHRHGTPCPERTCWTSTCTCCVCWPRLSGAPGAETRFPRPKK